MCAQFAQSLQDVRLPLPQQRAHTHAAADDHPYTKCTPGSPALAQQTQRDGSKQRFYVNSRHKHRAGQYRLSIDIVAEKTLDTFDAWFRKNDPLFNWKTR